MELSSDQSPASLGEERRILEVLSRTGAALAAELDLEKLVQIVTDAGVEVSGAAFGAFFYNKTDARGDSYMLYALSGAPRAAFEKFPVPSKTQLFGPTFEGKGIIRSDDITLDPRYGHNQPHHGMPPGHLEVRSYLAVPVQSRTRGVIGGLFFGHPEVGVFKEQAERLIEGLAAQAAIAVDNALLYQAVQHSERRFRALIENSTDSIVVFDANNKVLYRTPSVHRLEGYTDEELDQSDGLDITHPDDVPKLKAAFASLLRDPSKQQSLLWRRRHKDGHWMWLEGISTNLIGDPAVGGMVTNYRDVTARIDAEQALRESEEKFAAAFMLSPLPMVISDMESHFIDINQAFTDITGYTRDEMIGTHVMQTATISPPDRDKLIAEMQRTGGYARNVEVRIHPRDGTTRYVLFSIITVTINGKPRRLSTALDITDRKIAEESVRRLNRTYAVLSDINQLIVRETDEKTILDNACSIAVKQGGFLLAWVGLRDGDTSTQRLKLVAHAGASEEMLAVVQDIVSQGEQGCAFTAQALRTSKQAVCNDIEADPLSANWRRIALDSGYRSMASFPLVLDDVCKGTLNLYAGASHFFDSDEQVLLDELARDIAFALGSCERERERKQAQDELRRSEERFRALIEGASDLITVLDAQGVIRYASPSLRQVLGYSPSELQGKSAADFVHPDDRAQVVATIQRALASPMTSIELEHRIAHRDGTWRRVHSLSRSLPEESPDGFIVVNSRDVTERHTLEQQLAQSQKMQAMGTLAGGIAHDFNNILSAIVGNAELARMDVGDLHPAQTSIKEIQRAGQRARELIQRIMSFSRPQEQQLTPMQLTPVVDEAVRLLRSTIPAGIKLTVNAAESLPLVRADASQIHQVVLNLVTNAWHALRDAGGCIDIQLSVCRVDSALTQVHSQLQPGPHVRLSVIDNGAGMDTATQARIFDPFFTTKPPGQGAGLGLSVVHGIVRAHRGAIVVDSASGRGSTFHIYFPVTEETAAPKPAVGVATRRGNGEHILYIDDEIALVTLAEQFLTRMGYRISGFTEPARALEAFHQAPQDFDVAITDFNMPGMSGLALAQELIRIKPTLPIALSSGYLRADEVERARSQGIREILLKPNNMEALPPLIDRLLKAR